MPAPRNFDRDKVTAIVLECIELGLPLVATVQTIMECTINQARHMVRTVREDGHLGSHPHLPARASVHRGSKLSRSWVVCQYCIEPWPCAKAYPTKKPKRRRKAEVAPS